MSYYVFVLITEIQTKTLKRSLLIVFMDNHEELSIKQRNRPTIVNFRYLNPIIGTKFGE